MNVFNLLDRIHAHTPMFISAAFVSVKYIKITQTSNCWFDRMIYFPITGKSWVTCSEVCFWAMKDIFGSSALEGSSLGDSTLWLDSLCGYQIPCCVQLHTFTCACRHRTLGVIPETQVKSVKNLNYTYVHTFIISVMQFFKMAFGKIQELKPEDQKH